MTGFGDVAGNFWIGNDQLNVLTTTGQLSHLRVDVQFLSDCQWYWAEYSTFVVDSEANNYRLTVAGYSGTAGDAMVTAGSIYNDLSGTYFCTEDVDNDQHLNIHCAVEPKVGQFCGGGFWYRDCSIANVNSPRGCNIVGFAWKLKYLSTSRLMIY